MPKNLILCAALFLIFSFFSYAEPVYKLYNHPEIKFYTIETENFFIHYGRENETLARYTAAVAEKAASRIKEKFKIPIVHKVDLIIRDNDDISNGIASFFDNTVTYFSLPMDFLLRDNTDWMENVVYHEIAHMIHLNYAPPPLLKLRKYAGHLLTKPNIASPIWFIEGFAQQAASLGSERYGSVRRMIIRTDVFENNFLPLSKMDRFGKTGLEAEKAYNYGYAFVKYLTENYGDEAIGEIIKIKADALVNFDAAFEAVTGASVADVYEKWRAAQFIKYGNLIKEKQKYQTVTSAGWYNSDFKYINETASVYITNLEEDYALNSLIITENGRAFKIDKNINNGVFLSADKNTVLYTKNKITQEGNDFSDIFSYCVKTGRKERISFGARAYFPSLSEEKNKLIYVSHSAARQSLVEVDLTDGKTRHLLTGGVNEQFFNPVIIKNDVYFEKFKNNKRGLYRVNLNTLKKNKVIDSKYIERDFNFVEGGILYSADYDGVFNIYFYKNDILYKLTDSYSGEFMPVLTADFLYTVKYGAEGFKIVKYGRSGLLWRGQKFIFEDEKKVYDYAVNYDTTPAKKYSPDFRPAYRIPWFMYDGSSALAGLFIFETDALSKHIFNAAAAYDFISSSPRGTAAYINRSFYPTVKLSVNSYADYYYNMFKNAASPYDRHYIEKIKTADMEFIIPIKRNSYIGLKTSVEKRRAANKSRIDPSLKQPFEGITSYQKISFNYENLISSSDMDLGITDGVKIELYFQKYLKIFGGSFNHEQYYINADFYKRMPYNKKHSFKLNFAAGMVEGKDFYPRSFSAGGWPALRGYGHNEFNASNMAYFSAEYTNPVIYDWSKSIGALYIDGLYMKTFFDLGEFSDNKIKLKNFYSGVGSVFILKSYVYYTVPLNLNLGFAQALKGEKDFRLILALGAIF